MIASLWTRGRSCYLSLLFTAWYFTRLIPLDPASSTGAIIWPWVHPTLWLHCNRRIGQNSRRVLPATLYWHSASFKYPLMLSQPRRIRWGEMAPKTHVIQSSKHSSILHDWLPLSLVDRGLNDFIEVGREKEYNDTSEFLGKLWSSWRLTWYETAWYRRPHVINVALPQK